MHHALITAVGSGLALTERGAERSESQQGHRKKALATPARRPRVAACPSLPGGGGTAGPLVATPKQSLVRVAQKCLRPGQGQGLWSPMPPKARK